MRLVLSVSFLLATSNFDANSFVLQVSQYNVDQCIHVFRFDRADSDLHVKPDLGFVCCLSSIKHLPEFHFYALNHQLNELLPTAQFQYKIRLQPSIATPISDKSLTESKMFETHAVVSDSTQPGNNYSVFFHVYIAKITYTFTQIDELNQKALFVF